MGYSIANQWTDLTKQFSDGIGQITDFLENGSLPFSITNEQIAEWISNGQKWVQDHAGDLAGQAAAGAGSVVEVFTALALAIFCTVFFLARGREMWTWFLNQLPARVRDSWKTAGGAGWYTFSGYTRGTVIIAVTDGILAFILLSILRVPLSAPLAVLVFIGAFIPLIGAPLAMVIAMIVALAANGLLSAAFVGIGIALIGQFEGHILQPIVMGKQVATPPGRHRARRHRRNPDRGHPRRRHRRAARGGVLGDLLPAAHARPADGGGRGGRRRRTGRRRRADRRRRGRSSRP